MGRPPKSTPEEIEAACEHLRERDGEENVTQHSLQEYLGGGSTVTLGRVLTAKRKEWAQEQAEQEQALQTPMPEGFGGLFERARDHAWGLAVRHFDSVMASEREAAVAARRQLEKARDSLQQDAQATAADLERVEEENENLKASVESLANERDRLLDEVGESKRLRAANHELVEEANAAKRTLQAAEHERDRLQRDLERETAEKRVAQERAEAFEAKVDQVRSKLEEKRDAERKELLEKLDSARTEFADKVEKANAEREAARRERDLAQHQRESLEQRVEQLEGQLATLEASKPEGARAASSKKQAGGQAKA